MADRSVVAFLGANVTGFVSGMGVAKTAATGFARDSAAAINRSNVAINTVTNSTGRLSAAAFSGYGLAAVAAVKAGEAFVGASADFEQGMANVRATGAATGDELHQLEDAALAMGRTTVYSATEAADGMEALLKAGLSARDVINGGLTGSFNLAAAGGLEVAEAAETAASAMAQFSLTGKDVPHIADLLAAGAGKANGDVRDLGQALNQAGLIAAGAGAGIEETTGTLAAFAKAGLLGSDAGTSFKTMLQRLQAPVGDAADLLDKLDISAYDSKGNFVGLADVAGQLQRALGGMTEKQRSAALATIFGTDAVRAANVLYKEGKGGIQDWTDRVNDAGYASDVAAKKTDTLRGDLDRMKNSWAALAEGSGASGGVRPLVRQLDELADALGKVLGYNSKWDEFTSKITGIEPGDSVGDTIRKLKLRLSNDTGVDDSVVVKFKTEGAANAVKDAAAVAHAANLTPTEVRSVLHLVGWSSEGIQTVLEKMDQVDRRKVRADLDLLGVPTARDDLGNLILDMDAFDASKPTADLAVNPLDAIAGAKKADKAIDGVKQNKKAPIDADPTPAETAAKRAQIAIDAVKGTTVAIRGIFSGLFQANGGILNYADGGIAAFANGGEYHDAQIAMGGTTRVWNEPETGGEAYIPLAPSKRERSLSIWEHTGEILGAFDSGQVQAAADSFRTRDQAGRSVSTLAGGHSGGGSAQQIVIPPLEAALVDNRLRIDKDGHIRLIDSRVQLGIRNETRYRNKGRG